MCVAALLAFVPIGDDAFGGLIGFLVALVAFTVGLTGGRRVVRAGIAIIGAVLIVTPGTNYVEHRLTDAQFSKDKSALLKQTEALELQVRRIEADAASSSIPNDQPEPSHGDEV